jgi:hypothetical protein
VWTAFFVKWINLKFRDLEGFRFATLC